MSGATGGAGPPVELRGPWAERCQGSARETAAGEAEPTEKRRNATSVRPRRARARPVGTDLGQGKRPRGGAAGETGHVAVRAGERRNLRVSAGA